MSNYNNSNGYLTNDELKNLADSIKDPFSFSKNVYVINPVQGKVRFDLYPFQKAVLYQFLNKRFNIILKFRQAGITELISLYCLWLAMYHPNKKINIISIKDTVAKKVLKKIKFMYRNLPHYLQIPIVNGRPGDLGTATVIEFNNGSFIESIPTSEQAGRSESLSLLVIDEAAAVRWASQIYASAIPTLSCLVGDTPIFCKVYHKTKAVTEILDIKTLCPEDKGIMDISNKGYYTLTHKGNWKLITHGVNKGVLKTWYVKDCRGKIIGATPAHRFYTPYGWKDLQTILENNLNVIQVDTKIGDIKPLEVGENEYRDYVTYISKLTLVKETLEHIYDITVKDDHSFISTNHFVNHNTGGSAIINSCITGDTEIITQNGNIRVDMICPKSIGVQDIRVLGLKTLSHTGTWQNILGTVNKGLLETWEIKNDKGAVLKCTPHHKLLTPRGWKTVEEIVRKDLKAIFFDTGLNDLNEPPKTVKPSKEILKPIKGFPNYQISNLGNVYRKTAVGWERKESRFMGKNSKYYRIGLWKQKHKYNFHIHRLVAETFLGKIPKGYVVDHINNNPTDNYLTNLEIVSPSENTRRACSYNYNLRIASKSGNGMPDIQLVGWIKSKSHLVKKYGDGVKLANRASKVFGKPVTSEYITRILRGDRVNSVYISKLQVLRKYEDYIYDINVEHDESYIIPNGYVSHNTPLGIGNFYHKQWVDAVSGESQMNPIRLYWEMHPDRGDEWYQEMASILGPRRTAQEIDGDFLSSGSTVFDLTDIRELEENLFEYPAIRERFGGQYKEFSMPDNESQYYIGADCATGRGTDYSAFTLMDGLGEEHAVFKGRIPLNKYARFLGDTGERFNFACIAPETNDIGMAVTTILQDEGYPNLYYTRKLLKKKGKQRHEVDVIPGWLTTTKNRSLIIENLEKDVREGNILVKDPFFINEAYTFIYDGSGRPIAMGKQKLKASSEEVDLEGETYSDDAIFGKAICNHVRKFNNNNSVVVMPK